LLCSKRNAVADIHGDTMDKRLLSILPENSHTGNSLLQTQYTLRCCSKDYRIQTGKYSNSPSPPELDGCKQPGKIALLTTFDTKYGHCMDGFTYVFKPSDYDTLEGWISYISNAVSASISKGRAWDIYGVHRVAVDSKSMYRSAHSDKFKRCIDAQMKYKWNPICAYPVQAYIEASERSKDQALYPIPSQSTLMTGILGGINNNVSINMGFEEPEGTYNMEMRTFKDDMLGFLCAGHTSHSQDAGKSRRLCSYTRIKVLSKDALWSLVDKHNTLIRGDKGWLIYCMGSTFETSLGGIAVLIERMNENLKLYCKSQFDYPNLSNMSAPPTYFVCYQEKILLISISPGVILRMMPNGTMIDSSMLHHQQSNSATRHAKLPESGPESIAYKYSAFFLLCPFLEYDRPPRTLLASVQTVQAVCAPWSPATARVSPIHVSKPLVSTKFGREIEQDQDANPEAIWDIIPGEDMTVCFMNHPLNYDDSMVVSSRFADMGGFATLSTCTYRISPKDPRPDIGEQLCRNRYPWWKMPCMHHCKCMSTTKRESTTAKAISIRPMNQISNSRIPTGTVLECNEVENGDIQIRVLSYAQILTGDKISTTHGQKGIARIAPYHDLPLIVMPDGSSFVADLYMAVGSVISRQTAGQIYESGAGWRAAALGKIATADIEDSSTETCSYLIDSITGKVIVSAMPDGSIQKIEATVGITRVFNQTQFTRERHHLTHSSEGKYSLGTTPGRAQGGGVAASEMDFHAMFSSGLVSCAQEMLNRGNVVRVPVCIECKHVSVLCDCLESGSTVNVRLSYDTVIFDIMSACINGSCNTYEMEHV